MLAIGARFRSAGDDARRLATPARVARDGEESAHAPRATIGPAIFSQSLVRCGGMWLRPRFLLEGRASFIHPLVCVTACARRFHPLIGSDPASIADRFVSHGARDRPTFARPGPSVA